MKTRILLLLVVCCHTVHADGSELPLLGKLPDLGRDWVLQKQVTKKEKTYEYSWATFTNSKTGDIMSFAADRFPNIKRAVGSAPVRQGASEMFPRFMLNEPADCIINEIRCRVIALGTGSTAARKNVDAEVLEYSSVYESKANTTPNRLGHGYVLAFGDTLIFVQHTSTHVITSDDAMGMATSVLRIRLGLKQ